MTILVTGANGQLGNEMRILASGREEKFIFSDVLEAKGVSTVMLDITDRDAVAQIVSEHNVRIIVNCAAYTNVDKAEDEPELSAMLNENAPGILADVMKEVDGLLVHVSTDYVFGGTAYNIPCSEACEGNPTSVYGSTKLAGEKAISMSGTDYVIIRTAWLYSEYGRNFLKTMLSLTEERTKVDVVFDQVGTPTYALDLAETILTVIDDYKLESVHGSSEKYSKSGIYHYSNEGVCSWYDFAYTIAHLAGHNHCHVSPCHTAQYPSKVRRPSYSVLDKTKIKSTFGISIPHWVDSLKRCLVNLK